MTASTGAIGQKAAKLVSPDTLCAEDYRVMDAVFAQLLRDKELRVARNQIIVLNATTSTEPSIFNTWYEHGATDEEGHTTPGDVFYSSWKRNQHAENWNGKMVRTSRIRVLNLRNLKPPRMPVYHGKSIAFIHETAPGSDAPMTSRQFAAAFRNAFPNGAYYIYAEKPGYSINGKTARVVLRRDVWGETDFLLVKAHSKWMVKSWHNRPGPPSWANHLCA